MRRIEVACRRLPALVGVGAALAATLLAGCGLASERNADVTGRIPAAGHPAISDQQTADVYVATLRKHLESDLPVSSGAWNGILYLPTAARDDAADPMVSPFGSGEQDIAPTVQQLVTRQLAGLADVRWVSRGKQANLESLEAEECDPSPSPILVASAGTTTRHNGRTGYL